MAFATEYRPSCFGLERHLVVFAAIVANDLKPFRRIAARSCLLRTAFSTPLRSGHVPLVKHFLFLFGEKKRLSTLNASGLDIRHRSNSYPINSR
jgi:hypothetical protein